MADLDADYFDGWYAALDDSGPVNAIQQESLGLPREVASTSLLGLAGLEELGGTLRLRPGSVLLDLACGRGGYGLWLARAHGCRLVGVDFSAVAVRMATERAARDFAGVAAEFRVGELEASGLLDSSVDAVLCVDAVQFATSPAAVGAEVARVLRPGGTAALTCWEARDRGDADVSDRLRDLDLRDLVAAAPQLTVTVQERADWRTAERVMWERAVELDPGDDPALLSFVGEGRRSLARFDHLRRVLAVVTSA